MIERSLSLGTPHDLRAAARCECGPTGCEHRINHSARYQPGDSWGACCNTRSAGPCSRHGKRPSARPRRLELNLTLHRPYLSPSREESGLTPPAGCSRGILLWSPEFRYFGKRAACLLSLHKPREQKADEPIGETLPGLLICLATCKMMLDQRMTRFSKKLEVNS